MYMNEVNANEWDYRPNLLLISSGGNASNYSVFVILFYN